MCASSVVGSVEERRWKVGTEKGRWEMEDGAWRMEDGAWRMEDGGWKMEDRNSSVCGNLLLRSGVGSGVVG